VMRGARRDRLWALGRLQLHLADFFR